MNVVQDKPQLDQNIKPGVHQGTKKAGIFIGAAVLFICIVLMLVFIFDKKPQGVIPAVNTTTKVPPADPEQQKLQAVKTQANKYDNNNQFDKAATELKTYVESNPREEEKLQASADLAAAYMNSQEYDKAIATYEELGKHTSYKLASLHGLAIAYRSKGEIQKAIDYYKEAIAFMEANGKTNETLYTTDKNVVTRLEAQLNQQ